MADTKIGPYVDGYFGTEQQITVTPIPEFPFATNPTPDTFSRVYRRMFRVLASFYRPKISNRTTWVNLLKYSEQIDNAAWTKTNISVTADAATAPDGQKTLDKLLETVTNAEHSIAQAATVTAAPTEVSVYAVGGLGRDWVKVVFTDSAAAVFSCFFNVTNGYVGTASAGVTAKVVALGDGFFRLVMSFTPAVGAGTCKVNVASSANMVSYAGDVTKGVYLWGAQVMTAVGGPYVSTTGATRSVSAPDVDQFDAMAYQVDEKDPALENSQTAIVERSYARMPQQQIVPGSIFITKPDIPGTFPQIFGNYVVFRPIASVASYDAYSPQVVTVDGGPNASAATGGTYTLTYSGQTTSAIAFNASAATVQTALNALGKISALGGVTVTGSASAGFSIAFAALTLLTVNTAGLTVTGGSVTSSPFGGSGTVGNFRGIPQIQINTGPGQTFTGGTFTITILGQTTSAIAYNATPATVAAALNALSNFAAFGYTAVVTNAGSGAGTIYPGSYYLLFDVTVSVPSFTITSTLLPSGLAPAIVRDGYNVGNVQSLTFPVGSGTRLLTIPAHGFAPTDTLFVLIGANYYGAIAPGGFTLPDANTVLISQAGGQLTDTGLATQAGKRTITGYSPTAKLTRVKYITDFYLLGVTPGITTIDDIPQPVYQGDPASLLTAIFAGTTTINYQIGDLKQWRGPILQRLTTTLNAATL